MQEGEAYHKFVITRVAVTFDVVFLTGKKKKGKNGERERRRRREGKEKKKKDIESVKSAAILCTTSGAVYLCVGPGRGDTTVKRDTAGKR